MCRQKRYILVFQVFIYALILFFGEINEIETAVSAPPWANPRLNPCASQPRGWQLLYWPPDGKCYKIFQIGYPCPEDMELTPSPTTSGAQQLSAECRCPPKTAQSARDGRCYELFTIGPCERGQYFAPDTHYGSSSSKKRRWGACKQTRICPNRNEIFWPQTGHCYEKLSRGPCAKGQLITTGADKLAVCKCNEMDDLKDYYTANGCYAHFTKGPCKEDGHLFLPDRTCGCHRFLPHFHEETQQCFEIGTIGPCSPGEFYQLNAEGTGGICECKNGNIRYEEDGNCYRPYTQGPCPLGYMLMNATACAQIACLKGELYFPEFAACHRIGTRGPCKNGQLVTFDFKTRPSIDGISYNGVCSCEKDSGNCKESANVCDRDNGTILYKNKCYKLYTKGPCVRGAWLAPKRQKKEEIWTEAENRKREAACECMPGYVKSVRRYNERKITECVSPTVILADYLNNGSVFAVIKEDN